VPQSAPAWEIAPKRDTFSYSVAILACEEGGERQKMERNTMLQYAGDVVTRYTAHVALERGIICYSDDRTDAKFIGNPC
jgi:hypothetical protein